MAKRQHQRGHAPSTRLKDGLFRLYGQIPEHGGNLWLVHSTRNRRQWIINGDLKFLHFLYLEFEPSVISFEIRPAPVVIDNDAAKGEVTFDAVVRFDDGRTECRLVKASGEVNEPQDAQVPPTKNLLELAAARCGGVCVLIGLGDLESRRNRVLNGLRMNRFLTAARNEPLEGHCNDVLISLKNAHGASTLDDLCERLNHVHVAFAYAAVFRLYQLRRVHLDLNAGPLHKHSIVRSSHERR